MYFCQTLSPIHLHWRLPELRHLWGWESKRREEGSTCWSALWFPVQHWSDFQCHSTKSPEVFRIVQLSRIPDLLVVIFLECCQNAEVRRINILSKSISDIENFLSKASDILRTFLSQFLSHDLLQVSFSIMKIGSLGGQGQDFYFAAFWACFTLFCG